MIIPRTITDELQYCKDRLDDCMLENKEYITNRELIMYNNVRNNMTLEGDPSMDWNDECNVRGPARYIVPGAIAEILETRRLRRCGYIVRTVQDRVNQVDKKIDLFAHKVNKSEISIQVKAGIINNNILIYPDYFEGEANRLTVVDIERNLFATLDREAFHRLYKECGNKIPVEQFKNTKYAQLY